MVNSRTLSLVLVLSLSVALPACQKRPAKKKQAEICGGRADISLDKNKVVRQDTMKLRREYETVRHTDCNGVTKTSKLLVTEPKESYTIMLKNIPQAARDYEVWAFNRTTCDNATIKKRENKDPKMEVQVHTSRGTRRTYVLKNQQNYIDYEFRECLKRDANNQCTSSQVAERGTLVLYIDYSEGDKPGVRETKADCGKTSDTQAEKRP